MSTPAFCVLPLLAMMRGRVHSARWRAAIEAIILASAALILGTAMSLIPTAVVDVQTAVIAMLALLVVSFTSMPTIWVIVAGVAVTLLLPY
jgi:hypothetical protein